MTYNVFSGTQTGVYNLKPENFILLAFARKFPRGRVAAVYVHGTRNSPCGCCHLLHIFAIVRGFGIPQVSVIESRLSQRPLATRH